MIGVQVKSFKDINEYKLLSALRREKLIDWVGLHPQLRATDGDEYLKVLLKHSSVDELYVAGCDPVMQKRCSGTPLVQQDLPNINT